MTNINDPLNPCGNLRKPIRVYTGCSVWPKLRRQLGARDGAQPTSYRTPDSARAKTKVRSHTHTLLSVTQHLCVGPSRGTTHKRKPEPVKKNKKTHEPLLVNMHVQMRACPDVLKHD